MKSLTKKQIELLPTVKENAPKNKKGEVLKRLIDGYLGGEKLQKCDLDIIKIAVQLHQTHEKKKRLQAQQRQHNYKEIKAENAKKTREKIILGACDVVALKNGGYPFLNFLLAWANGYVSDNDLQFMGERYKIIETKNRDGFRLLKLWANDNIFYVRDWYDVDGKYKFSYGIANADGTQTITSLILKTYDCDPRGSYVN